MEWLGTVRYGLALLLYSSLPAALLYWYLIHPFTGFWRRVGVTRTFVIVGAAFLALVVTLASQHRWVLAKSYPFSWPLAITGLGLYAIAVVLEVACRRHLAFSILAGVPQIGEDPGRLLTDGIYSRVRNPRYLAIVVGIGGFCLILNYPALYLVYLLTLPALHGVVLLEERELADRFGEKYRAYCRRVPRWIPRRGAADRNPPPD